MTTVLKNIGCLVAVLLLFTCSKNSTDGNGEEPPPFWSRYSDFEAAWSPDGKTIAFISGGNPDKQIPAGLYFVDLDGKNRRLFFPGAKVYAPDWSPDGEWIVFSDYAQIYRIKANGDSLTQLTFEGRNFFPDWSPDEERIAYDSNFDDPNGANLIWIMNADGTNKQDISQHGTGEWRQPSWSPDGEKIVHSRYIGVGTQEIFVMDGNGQNAKRLTFDEKNDCFPEFSPDGSKIVFSSYKESPPQIFVMDEDGSNLKQLTTQGADCPAWSPDGKEIVYTDVRREYGRLFVMKADGSDKRQLTFEE